MAFHRYIGPLYAVNSLFSVLFWKTVQKYGKLLFFRGLRPDWGNTTRAAMDGLGSIGLIVLVIFH